MIIFLYLFNSTYQAYVPIFVDMEMVSEYTVLCRIWEVVRIIEALSIFISFIIYLPFFKILHTSGRFHINLRRIFEFVSLHLFFNQLLRLVLLFYEGQAVLGDAVTFCDTVIFIIGLIRCYTLLFLASIVPLITLERLMATIYLWDYEKSPRTYISLSIMLSSVLIFLTLSTFSCIAVAYDMLRTVIGVVISLLGAILLSGMLCAFLFTYNSKVLKWLDRVQQHERVESLTPRFGHRPYDLSVRYQIKENMRVFVILRRFLIITIISETFGSITGGIAFTAFESDSIIGQVMMIGVDLMLTLSFTTFPFGVLWIVKEWREKYDQWWRHLFRTNKSVSVASSLIIPSIDYAGDTNKYFDYYRQNW